jgi:hypothetical protein
MKHLIKHLLRENQDEILNRSLKNCHCKGLHSIMLSETPGKTIRLYVTEFDHEMDRNFPFEFQDRGLSIGFHPHHCNLTLYVVKGSIMNWVVKEIDKNEPENEDRLNFNLDKYNYKSKITENEMSFDLMEKDVKLETLGAFIYNKGMSIYMTGDEIHTIGVAAKSITAWLVFEGREDPNYQSVCYTNSNPNIKDPELYQKFGSIEEITKMLYRAETIERE